MYLISKEFMNIRFLSKQESGGNYCIVLEIALDNYNGEAEERYIHVTPELFNILKHKFNNKGEGLLMSEDTILYHLTKEQAEMICKHFDKDMNTLEKYEIAELLDRYIDELAQ